MTQEEFEARIGHQVAAEEFETANSIYMNSSLDKDEFCEAYKHINPSTFKLVKDLSERVDHFRQSRNDIHERDKEIGEHLAQLAHARGGHELREAARTILGWHNYIVYCLNQGLALESSDREYIISRLKED